MRPDPGDGITVQVKKAPPGETRAVFTRRILLPRKPLPRPGGRVVGTLYIMRSFLVLPVLAFSILGVVRPGAQEAPSSLEFLNRLLARGEPGAPPSPPRIEPRADPASAALYDALYDALRAHAEYLAAAIRNGRDLISYYRVWDGYVETLSGSLERIRELALRNGDGLSGPEERGILEFEIDLHYDGVLRTLERAEFNGRRLFGPWMGDERIRGIFSDSRFRDVEGVDAMLAALRAERARIGAAISATDSFVRGRSAEAADAAGSAGSGAAPDGLSSLQEGSIRFLADFFRMGSGDRGIP